MGGSAHLNYAAGALCSVGGAVGFLKKRSMMSLAGGCGLGGLYLVSAATIVSLELPSGEAAMA